jgi:hypothetical protein
VSAVQWGHLEVLQGGVNKPWPENLWRLNSPVLRTTQISKTIDRSLFMFSSPRTNEKIQATKKDFRSGWKQLSKQDVWYDDGTSRHEAIKTQTTKS